MGSVYKRKGSKNWWIRYRQDGKDIYESAKSQKKTVAQKLLAKKEGAIANGQPILSEKATFGEIKEDFLNDYRLNGRKSLERAEISMRHLEGFFRGHKANRITTATIKEYTQTRLIEGAAPATINRELAALRRALRLAYHDNKVARVPHVPLLKENNVRTGVLQAREPFYTITKEGFAQARRLCEEAIALDPDYAGAYAYLGSTHFMDAIMGSSKSPKDSLKLAFKSIKKAIALDDSFAEAHSLLGFLYVLTKKYDEGIAECERAIALEPNSAGAYIWMSLVLTHAGSHGEAVRCAERALRLDPLPAGWWFRALGQAYSWVGRYEEAIAAYKKALKRAPNDIRTHLPLTVVYSWAGRSDEALVQAGEVLRINPKYSLEVAAKTSLYKKQADRERYLDGLRKAGIPETPPLPLPDKPSIAVLPFENMSGDPDQVYFSDGITEEIITALSKTPKLFVIARTSSFKYKGKEVDVRTAGRELGVRYVLEGSVRRSEDQLRITAQLIDTKTGNHLWAERYDRKMRDVFALQDEITMKILIALQVELTEGEQARVYGKGTQNLEAYLLCLQAEKEITRLNKDGLVRARQLVQEAITLDPSYARAYHFWALTYVNEVILTLTKEPKKSLAGGVELEQKALALDDSLSWGHALLGWLYTLQRQHDKGIMECEQAVRLEPNSAAAHFYLSLALKYAGRAKESITISKEAIRLDPIPVSIYYQGITTAYCHTGQYEEAIAAGKKAVDLGPNNMVARAFLTVAYSLSGKEEEASIEAKEVKRINPKFSVDEWAKTMPYRNQADKELIITALRKAGLN